MAMDYTADLMQALIDRLYSTITGDDENIKIPRNKFVTWLLPGIPFTPEDFQFCSRGLGAGATATEDKMMYQQAFYISKLFDFIPEINDSLVYTGALEQYIFSSTQASISSVYGNILKFSQVVCNEISPEQQAKIKKFRDMMFTTKEIQDPYIDDKTIHLNIPGPITVAYETKSKEYIEAVDEYMDMLIGAQGATGSDPEDKRLVAAWANKAPIMRKKVNAAYSAWISQGYKNEYEEMNGFIDQITQRSMVLYKKDLQEKYERSRLTNPGAGDAGDFFYTTLLPGNFATSGGWTNFTFSHKDLENYNERNAGQKSAAYAESSSSYSHDVSSKSSMKRSYSAHQSGRTKAPGVFSSVSKIAGGIIGGALGGSIGSAVGSAIGGIAGDIVAAPGSNSSADSRSSFESNSSYSDKSRSDESSKSGSSDSSFETINIKNESQQFSAKFTFTQVPICRPFMDPGLFTMRGWRLSEDWFSFISEDTICDGYKDNPSGIMVAYPISALFIKDIEFTFSKELTNDLLDQAEAHSQNNSTVGFGIVNLTGSSSTKRDASSSSSSSSSKKTGIFSSTVKNSYSIDQQRSSSSSNNSSEKRENFNSGESSESSDESRKTHLIVSEDGKTLRIPGMQLIGFVNHCLKKCPDTNEKIADDMFV
jgi:hypothetical protein